MFIQILAESPKRETKAKILKQMAGQAPFGVWTPTDFLDLGSRGAVDEAQPSLV